jgi:hypothetical protein
MTSSLAVRVLISEERGMLNGIKRVDQYNTNRFILPLPLLPDYLKHNVAGILCDRSYCFKGILFLKKTFSCL